MVASRQADQAASPTAEGASRSAAPSRPRARIAEDWTAVQAGRLGRQPNAAGPWCRGAAACTNAAAAARGGGGGAGRQTPAPASSTRQHGPQRRIQAIADQRAQGQDGEPAPSSLIARTGRRSCLTRTEPITMPRGHGRIPQPTVSAFREGSARRRGQALGDDVEPASREQKQGQSSGLPRRSGPVRPTRGPQRGPGRAGAARGGAARNAVRRMRATAERHGSRCPQAVLCGSDGRRRRRRPHRTEDLAGWLEGHAA